MDYNVALADSSVEVLHDFLGTILQLKAHLRVAQNALDETKHTILDQYVSKEAVGQFQGRIDDLTAELENTRNSLVNVQREADANKQKASHIDTFVNEVNSLRGINKNLNDQINALQEKNQECVAKILELEKSDSEKSDKIRQLQYTLDKLNSKLDKASSPTSSQSKKKLLTEKSPSPEPVIKQPSVATTSLANPSEKVGNDSNDDF